MIIQAMFQFLSVRYWSGIIMGLIVGLGIGVSAPALTNDFIFTRFQFNFITPGARATAMGGAFIGLADDATAAATNPAGLTALQEAEMSAELQYISYTTEYPFENPYFIDMAGYAADYQNSLPQNPLRWMPFDDSVVGLPFVSVVYPFSNIIMSLYRQESANYKSSYRTGSYLIAVPDAQYLWWPEDASVEMRIANYGIGAAIEPWDGLSFAVSPRWSQLNIQSHQAYFNVDESRRYSTQFENAQVRSEYIINGNDGQFSLNAGIRWDAHPKFSIGAVYRSGPQFELTAEPGREGYQWLEPRNVEVYDADLADFTLKVPDSFGAGLAFRPNDTLTMTFDAVYIQYEDLLKDFDIISQEYGDVVTVESFTVNNAIELHFGLEYVLVLAERIVTLRTGVYNEPEHAIRFNGKATDYDGVQAYRSRFPRGDDYVHVTGGMGMVFNERTQIDAAMDFAENRQQFSVSAVYRF